MGKRTRRRIGRHPAPGRTSIARTVPAVLRALPRAVLVAACSPAPRRSPFSSDATAVPPRCARAPSVRAGDGRRWLRPARDAWAWETRRVLLVLADPVDAAVASRHDGLVPGTSERERRAGLRDGSALDPVFGTACASEYRLAGIRRPWRRSALAVPDRPEDGHGVPDRGAGRTDPEGLDRLERRPGAGSAQVGGRAGRRLVAVRTPGLADRRPGGTRPAVNRPGSRSSRAYSGVRHGHAEEASRGRMDERRPRCPDGRSWRRASSDGVPPPLRQGSRVRRPTFGGAFAPCPRTASQRDEVRRRTAMAVEHPHARHGVAGRRFGDRAGPGRSTFAPEATSSTFRGSSHATRSASRSRPADCRVFEVEMRMPPVGMIDGPQGTFRDGVGRGGCCGGCGARVASGGSSFRVGQ